VIMTPRGPSRGSLVDYFDHMEADAREQTRCCLDFKYPCTAGDSRLYRPETTPMYIHPGILAQRPGALRRNLSRCFELPEGQTIVVPRIVVRFFGVEAVVNDDVQRGFLHDRDCSL